MFDGRAGQTRRDSVGGVYDGSSPAARGGPRLCLPRRVLGRRHDFGLLEHRRRARRAGAALGRNARIDPTARVETSIRGTMWRSARGAVLEECVVTDGVASARRPLSPRGLSARRKTLVRTEPTSI